MFDVGIKKWLEFWCTWVILQWVILQQLFYDIRLCSVQNITKTWGICYCTMITGLGAVWVSPPGGENLWCRYKEMAWFWVYLGYIIITVWWYTFMIDLQCTKDISNLSNYFAIKTGVGAGGASSPGGEKFWSWYKEVVWFRVYLGHITITIRRYTSMVVPHCNKDISNLLLYNY